MKLPIVLLFFLFGIITLANADADVIPTVSVSYTLEPETLLPGDSGTVTFELNNMATGEVTTVGEGEDSEDFDMNAYIVSATLKGDDAEVDSAGTSFTDVGLLGPGDSITLTFDIIAAANATTGTHYLNLEVVGGSDMEDLNYKIPVKVDSRKVDLILADFPSVAINEVSAVSVDVVNPLSGDITGVTVTPSGEDVVFSPSEIFLGTIKGSNRSTADFTLNTMNSAEGLKDISFTASYYNGDNLHYTAPEETALEIVERSSLIFTGVEILRTGRKYLFSGDVNNFGTTSARNVMLSVYPADGVEPASPSSSYYVGTLEEDDFSGFELSALITGDNVTELPVLIEFRDSENAYVSTVGTLPLEGNTAFSSSSSGDSEGTPLWIWLILILSVVLVGFAIHRSWKGSKKESEQDVNDEYGG
jgi:hypothetical protein